MAQREANPALIEEAAGSLPVSAAPPATVGRGIPVGPEVTPTQSHASNAAFALLTGDGNLRVTYAKPPNHRVYVPLELHNLFSGLYSVYKPYFESLRSEFRNVMHPAAPEMRYIAADYIMACIQRLKYDHFHCLRALSTAAFSECFPEGHPGTTPLVFEVDPFMKLIIEGLRPRAVKHGINEHMYIADIRNIPNSCVGQAATFIPNALRTVANELQNYAFDLERLDRFLAIRRALRSQEVHEISITSPTGRPWWLFDVYNNYSGVNYIATWFPVEGNVTNEDIVIATILGSRCHARMAPVDIDDWQVGRDDVDYAGLNQGTVDALARITPRSWTAGAVFRRLEVFNSVPVAVGNITGTALPVGIRNAIGVADNSCSDPMNKANRKNLFRILDYTYCAILCTGWTDQQREACFKYYVPVHSVAQRR